MTVEDHRDGDGRTPQVESQWSHRLIAEALDEIGISASQVGRILADLDLKPHLVRSWLTRPDDPDFAERAVDVCGLYLHHPGDNALVLSVDEKTAIPARSRRHPTKRCQTGLIERQEFEYRRHGTACLMAALNVHTGEVLATDAVRNDADNFIGFLDQIDMLTPDELIVHLVMDNGASHVAKKTQAWLGRTSPLRRPPHPETCIVAEPGRAVLLDPQPQTAPPRRVRLPRRTRRPHHGLHPRAQPHRPTIRLDLRRHTPQGRMT